MQKMVRELNHFYKDTPAMYAADDGWHGYLWLNADDSEHSTASWMRMDGKGNMVLCALNFTPIPQDEYTLGVPSSGVFTESFSTDDVRFGGTGNYHNGVVHTEEIPFLSFQHRVRIKLPPYGGVYFTYTKG